MAPCGRRSQPAALVLALLSSADANAPGQPSAAGGLPHVVGGRFVDPLAHPRRGDPTLPSWEVALPQHTNSEHLRTRPRTRYSHTMTLVGEELVLYSGYYYDHWDAAGPTWHTDVWAFNPTGPDSAVTWRLVTDGAKAGDPPKRMNHVAVAPPGGRSLMIFGGSDIEHKSMNDLWLLDVPSASWTQLVPKSKLPPARHCFSASWVGNAMLVYGGFRLADLWAYTPHDSKWALLSDKATAGQDSPDHPGIRSAHSTVPGPNGDDLYLYGGFRFEADVSDSTRYPWGKLGDMWRFSISEKKWHAIPQQESNGGRQYFGMEFVSWPSIAGEEEDDTGLLVSGGAQCNPNCNLVGHTDFFSLRENKWHRLEVDRATLHRYKHTMTLHRGALWLFGGESFDPHMYHNAVERLAWPPSYNTSPVQEL